MPAPIPCVSRFPPRVYPGSHPGSHLTAVTPGTGRVLRSGRGRARPRSSRGGARIPVPRRGAVTARPGAFAAAEEGRSGSDAMEAMPVPPASPAALVPAPAAGPVAVTGKEVVSPAARHSKKILDEEAYIEVRRRARAQAREAPLRRCLGRALPARRGSPGVRPARPGRGRCSLPPRLQVEVAPGPPLGLPGPGARGRPSGCRGPCARLSALCRGPGPPVALRRWPRAEPALQVSQHCSCLCLCRA